MSAPITGTPLELAKADRQAEQLAVWLEPYCERIQVAGSIRRRRPLCNDIDLVVIPHIAEHTVQVDLLQQKTVRSNQVLAFLRTYVETAGGLAAWKAATPANPRIPKRDAQNLLLILRTGVQLDIWCADESTWWTRLICRTGSPGHNAWCCERAQHLGFKWSAYQGFEFDDGTTETITSEKMFYERLGLEFVPPHRRERSFMQLAERRGGNA